MSARAAVSTAVSLLTRAVARIGLARLYDFGPLGSVLVPDLEDGSIRVARLLPGQPREHGGPALTGPPRSAAPNAELEAAYVVEPWPALDSLAVTVTGARLVGKNGALVAPASGHVFFESACMRWTVVPKLGLDRRARAFSRRRRLTGRVVFLPTFRAENYYHFITDVLARLYAFSDEGRAGVAELRERVAGIVFVLDAAGPVWQRELVQGLLGLRVRAETLTERSNLVVDELVFPTFVGSTYPGKIGMTLFPRPVLDWVGRVFREAAGAEEDAEPDVRLYVGRSDALWRRVANEDALAALLAARGFEQVRGGDLSEAEAIRLFARTSMIVGPHGAGLAHLIWARRCSVLELHSPSFLSPAYYAVADALGHDYGYVVGEAAGGPGDYEVPLAAVEELLDRMDAAIGSR